MWIEVNVEDEIGEVSIAIDFDTIKMFFKQFARALVGFVDGFGVGAKQRLESVVSRGGIGLL
ncbi:MAG: hypothetical protein HC853_11075 [Anaerolineae bacterium]|nr:hypothetical protein [Anaerolineae bacterium]